MDTAGSTRAAALVCIIGTAAGVVYADAGASTGWEPSLGFAQQALLHVAELAGVIGLALSGAAGAGWLGQIGLGAAVLGQVLLIVAELTFPGSPDLADQIFNVAPPLSAIGMVLAGIAVLRVGRWAGWHRFTPLLVGLYVFVVVTPVLVISGGPPAAAALWALTGWELCWLLLGVALWATAGSAVRPRRASAVV